MSPYEYNQLTKILKIHKIKEQKSYKIKIRLNTVNMVK